MGFYDIWRAKLIFLGKISASQHPFSPILDPWERRKTILLRSKWAILPIRPKWYSSTSYSVDNCFGSLLLPTSHALIMIDMSLYNTKISDSIIFSIFLYFACPALLPSLDTFFLATLAPGVSIGGLGKVFDPCYVKLFHQVNLKKC